MNAIGAIEQYINTTIEVGFGKSGLSRRNLQETRNEVEAEVHFKSDALSVFGLNRKFWIDVKEEATGNC